MKIRKETIAGYTFLLPWLIGFIIFWAGPIIATFALSFCKWSLISGSRIVGVRNYLKLFSDERFYKSLKVTGIYVGVGLPLRIIVALVAAVLLHRGLKFFGFFKTVFYAPGIVPGVALAVMWIWVLNPSIGLVNQVLGFFRIKGPLWLFSETWALPAMILLFIWQSGPAMIIYLAGLQGIPPAYYEAAELDNAGVFARFFYITLPLLTPLIFFNLIVGIINNFQVFVPAYVMTQGGPNDATLFYVLYLYQNAFQSFKFGYAATMATILFVLMAALALIIFRSSQSWVYYQ